MKTNVALSIFVSWFTEPKHKRKPETSEKTEHHIPTEPYPITFSNPDRHEHNKHEDDFDFELAGIHFVSDLLSCLVLDEYSQHTHASSMQTYL